jgi:hypothetical protein
MAGPKLVCLACGLLGLACVAAPAPAPAPAQPVAELTAPAPTLADTETPSAPVEPDPTKPEQPRATIPGTPPYPPNTDWCERINREGAQPPGPVIPGPATNPAVPKPPGPSPIAYILGRPAVPERRESFHYVLWKRSLDTPDPSWSALRKTEWARSDRRPGCTRVHICVAADGTVASVETILPFRDDPEVDAIVRETVAGWSFAPIEDPRPMCWDRAFPIELPESD